MRYIFFISSFLFFSVKKVFSVKKIFSVEKHFFLQIMYMLYKPQIFFLKFFFNLVLQQMSNQSKPRKFYTSSYLNFLVIIVFWSNVDL